LGLLFILSCGNGNNGGETFNPELLSSDCVAGDAMNETLNFGNWECEFGGLILGVPGVGSGGVWVATDCETIRSINDTLENVTAETDTSFSASAWLVQFPKDEEPQDFGLTTCSFSPF
jgi:hypothetical protein